MNRQQCSGRGYEPLFTGGIHAGQLLPLNIAELQIAGYVHVTAIEPCPLIASGEGSVITRRFATPQVDTIALKLVSYVKEIR